jgi:hypothetical protein
MTAGEDEGVIHNYLSCSGDLHSPELFHHLISCSPGVMSSEDLFKVLHALLFSSHLATQIGNHRFLLVSLAILGLGTVVSSLFFILGQVDDPRLRHVLACGS